jgi:hypothetical protein
MLDGSAIILNIIRAFANGLEAATIFANFPQI